MRSTFGGMNALTRGLQVTQMALDTTGHNVANASTEGYSRQTVNMATAVPTTVYTGNGVVQLGSGVQVESITRARDTFADRQVWKESGYLGYGQTLEDIYGKVETIFGEPGDTGLQNLFDRFWTSWQSLGANASDDAARMAVRARGFELADGIQQVGQQLGEMVADINNEISVKVDRANQLFAQIADLNKQISGLEMSGQGAANDLRDRRDLLTDELGMLMKINVTEDRTGNYLIQAGGYAVVTGAGSIKLSVEKMADPDYGYEINQIVMAGTTTPFRVATGELAALVEARDSDSTGIKAYMNQINAMSQFLLTDFNAVHRAGFGTDGSTGYNFFGQSGVNYATTSLAGSWLDELEVSSALYDPASGLARIAAKSTAAMGSGSGDNAILLAQKLRTDSSAILGNSSLLDYYTALTGALGVQTQSAQRMTANHQTLLDQVKNWRESTSGVNLDEEMANMIRFQNGYNAASRVITVMDEMFDKLINGTGVAGR